MPHSTNECLYPSNIKKYTTDELSNAWMLVLRTEYPHGGYKNLLSDNLPGLKPWSCSLAFWHLKCRRQYFVCFLRVSLGPGCLRTLCWSACVWHTHDKRSGAYLWLLEALEGEFVSTEHQCGTLIPAIKSTLMHLVSQLPSVWSSLIPVNHSSSPLRLSQYKTHRHNTICDYRLLTEAQKRCCIFHCFAHQPSWHVPDTPLTDRLNFLFLLFFGFLIMLHLSYQAVLSWKVRSACSWSR